MKSKFTDRAIWNYNQAIKLNQNFLRPEILKVNISFLIKYIGTLEIKRGYRML